MQLEIMSLTLEMESRSAYSMHSSKDPSIRMLCAGCVATTALDLGRIPSTFTVCAAIVAVLVLRAITYGVFAGAFLICH